MDGHHRSCRAAGQPPPLRSALPSTGSAASLLNKHSTRSSRALPHSPSHATLSSLSEGDDAVDCSKETFAVGEYHLSACPICLERFTLDNPAIIVQCEHSFHLQCLEAWRMRSAVCPVCLRPLARDGGRLMEERDTHRRRRHRLAMANAAIATLQLMPVLAAVGASGAAEDTDEEEDHEGHGRQQQQRDHRSPGATTTLLTHAEREEAAHHSDDEDADSAEGDRIACLGSAWSWLRRWCGRGEE